MKAWKKTYTVTLECDKDGKQTLNRVNDGFSTLEMLGLANRLNYEIHQQVNGTIRPDIVYRCAIRHAYELGWSHAEQATMRERPSCPVSWDTPWEDKR